MLLISSSLATAGASVVTSVPWEAAWCCASCWQTAASSNAETSGVCSKNLEWNSIIRSLFIENPELSCTCGDITKIQLHEPEFVE